MDCIYVSVEGTDFSVFEPLVFDTGLYLQNINRTGLRYEVGVSLDSNIVSVNGPFERNWYNDISIFRINMKLVLSPGERVVTDGVYGDEIFSTPNTFKYEGAHLQRK